MARSVRVLVLSLAAGLALAAQASAQISPDTRAAMDKLAWMRGVWSGPATGLTMEGPFSVTQTERVGPMLDGSVLLIEGRAYKADGSLGFNALAVNSWDPETKAYEIRAYSQGRALTAKLEITDNGWTWELPIGGGVVRYAADFKDGVWHETGDATFNGTTTRILEMSLKKVSETDWPLGKPPAPVAH
jgi:hypothetical protein